MGYDELYVNKEYIKYLENKVSNLLKDDNIDFQPDQVGRKQET